MFCWPFQSLTSTFIGGDVDIRFVMYTLLENTTNTPPIKRLLHKGLCRLRGAGSKAQYSEEEK
jgi:hypothetical protein